MEKKIILPINLHIISHNNKLLTSFSHLAWGSLFFLTGPLKILKIVSEVSLNCHLQVKVGPLKDSQRLVLKLCVTPASGHMLPGAGFL